MAKAAQIQERIKAIRKDLEKGVDRKKIVQKFTKKYNVGESAIDKYIKAAKELISADSRRVQAAADTQIAQRVEEAISGVLTVARKRELLMQIAEGRLEIPTKKPVWDQAQKKFVFLPMLELPDHAARMKAIDLDNKMTGDFAPTKVANTDSDGNDLPPVPPEIKIYHVGPPLAASEDQIDD